MRHFILVILIYNTNGQSNDLTQLSQVRKYEILKAEEKKETSADWVLDPVVQVRWDFSDCEKTGMFGPSQEDCSAAYFDSNLADNIRVNSGVQSWVVPADGLYLVTAAGPAGSSVGAGGRGRGAILEANFHLMKGEIIDIIVGQKSDYNLDIDPSSKRGLGGSGGTFVVRRQDSKILMAAGGGGGGAGIKSNLGLSKNVNDASPYPWGQDASSISRPPEGLEHLGNGGNEGSGGIFGADLLAPYGLRYGGGGGAGFGNLTGSPDDGDGGVHPTSKQRPRGAKNFLTKGTGMNSRGVGGYLQFKPRSTLIKIPITNNGGFGGGGYGSADGGAGGGGGYSGGGGGPADGYSGGGGSLNNGFRQTNKITNAGPGKFQCFE